MTACPADPLPSRRPRLVSFNPAASRTLMPLREIERRLAEIDRAFAGAGNDAPLREELQYRRGLIATLLATRLSHPREVHRLEQMLRWQTRSPGAILPAPSPLARMLRRLRTRLSVFGDATAVVQGAART